MKKIIIIGALVLTILMLVFFRFLPKPKPLEKEKEVLPTPTPPPSIVTSETFKGSLKDAVALGKAMECIWKNDDNFFSTGFIKGKQYFAKITRQGKTGFLIIKDNCLWTWDEGEKQGTKSCMELTGNKETIWDLKASMPETIYTCNPALVEDSQFNLPSQVEFVTEE